LIAICLFSFVEASASVFVFLNHLVSSEQCLNDGGDHLARRWNALLACLMSLRLHLSHEGGPWLHDSINSMKGPLFHRKSCFWTSFLPQENSSTLY